MLITRARTGYTRKGSMFLLILLRTGMSNAHIVPDIEDLTGMEHLS